ncbi:hypothetical protein F4778DRAFT_778706 [Xylariomycetidae sp. FL2044]|nr:hypothetical protein F4778DRAFT_778706 [Xylariomycetidae sp. FL2044]
MAVRPDLLVAIDVGMSCTGVAYFNASKRQQHLDPSLIRVLQQWEGKAVENKVPTVVVYDKLNVDAGPTSWGFATEAESQRGDDYIFHQWFKNWFHDESKRPADVEPPSTTTLYKDYLSKLNEHIRSNFTPNDLNGKTWDDARIEFLFSVPATWSSETTRRFIDVAQTAGFASPLGGTRVHPSHTIKATYTEPQAAAIYAASTDPDTFTDGDNVLIIDAGGGTTDLCLVTIENTARGTVSVAELNPVEGDEVGSSFIDQEFQELALMRLREIDGGGQNPLGWTKPIEDLAWDMMMSQDFQSNKPGVGNPRNGMSEVFRVTIPTVSAQQSHEYPRVVRGRMEFTWQDLATIFDRQIARIKDLVEKFLYEMQFSIKLPASFKLNHIIISGGLGSSRYVQDRLRELYQPQNPRPILEDVRFHASTDPRLCVCRGLLMDRLQELNTNKSVISRLSCRSSYGVVSDKTYNRWNSAHRKAKSQSKVENKQRLFKERIEWFINKGRIISPNEQVFYPYWKTFPAGTPKTSFIATVKIVSCAIDKPPDERRHMQVRDEALLVCDFSSLQDDEIRKKYKHWYDRLIGKKPEIEIHFGIASLVSSTGVQFECRLTRDGARLNVESPAITAEFDRVPVTISQSSIFGF